MRAYGDIIIIDQRGIQGSVLEEDCNKPDASRNILIFSYEL